MLGFSWNATLSRTAVGATLLLLMLSFSETHSWLEAATSFATSSASLGPGFQVGIFVFVAFAVGLVINTTAHSNPPEWEKAIAEVVVLKNDAAIGLVLDCRSRWEMMVGLGRVFYICAGTAGYYIVLQLVFRALEVSSPNSTHIGELLIIVILSCALGWLLLRLANRHFNEAETLVRHLKSLQVEEPIK